MKTSINNTIFDKLIANAECVTGDDTEVIGFEATYKNYSINFYHDYSLVIEECVREVSNEYMSLSLTNGQKLKCAGLINKRLHEIHNNQREDNYNAQLAYDHRNWLQSACGSSMF